MHHCISVTFPFFNFVVQKVAATCSCFFHYRVVFAHSKYIHVSLFPFPAGTIWMQEILPLVLNGGDLTPLQTIANWDRVPWLEENRLAMVVDQLPTPRAMVTHFPYHLMPPSLHTSKAKVRVLYTPSIATKYHF